MAGKGAGDKKRFTEEQVREAIAHSDYTQHSIANYLARHFAKDHKCNDMTAARYIKKFNLESEIEGGEIEITSLAYGNIKRAIQKGDTKTSKWWLERILRQKFGNEVTVHNDNSKPLKIDFGGYSIKDLTSNPNVEIGGIDESSVTEQ